MLRALYPDAVHIKGADCDFCADNVTIALTDEKIMQGEYDAILPLDIFDNIFVRKDERENEKTEVDIK